MLCVPTSKCQLFGCTSVHLEWGHVSPQPTGGGHTNQAVVDQSPRASELLVHLNTLHVRKMFVYVHNSHALLCLHVAGSKKLGCCSIPIPFHSIPFMHYTQMFHPSLKSWWMWWMMSFGLSTSSPLSQRMWFFSLLYVFITSCSVTVPCRSWKLLVVAYCNSFRMLQPVQIARSTKARCCTPPLL